MKGKAVRMIQDRWPWFRRMIPIEDTVIVQPIEIDTRPLDAQLEKSRDVIAVSMQIARGEHVPAQQLDLLSDLLIGPEKRKE